MSLTPTFEQNEIIKAFHEHKELQVRACAGAGKTSTLFLLAQSLVVPSLYLAFNKVTAQEAAAKFPPHVTSKTTHSMAYQVCGVGIADKLSRPRGGYVNVAGTGSEIANYYKIATEQIGENTYISGAFLGLLVKETVAKFEQSADEKITRDHIPTLELRTKLHDNADDLKRFKTIILGHAKSLWKDRINPRSKVLATHDTYLKLYQLTKPQFNGYQVVFVDEFQDTTPCVLDIIANQRGRMKIVMVGDARQAIYGWRGAINAMLAVQCPVRMLTKSFRYGQAIADVATAVLERDMVITGHEPIQSRVGGFDMVDRTQPHTRLFRTNSALLYAAVEEIRRGVAVRIEIDVKDFVKLLQSAQALYCGNMRQVKHDKVLPYNNWQEMVDEAKNDAELRRIVKVVSDGMAQDWVSVLDSHINPDNPLITFTTAHKSKGREFSQVVVESDFKTCYDEDGEWIGLPVEEQNLLYVGLTRAIHVLEYNATTSEYLNREKSEERQEQELLEAA